MILSPQRKKNLTISENQAAYTEHKAVGMQKEIRALTYLRF